MSVLFRNKMREKYEAYFEEQERLRGLCLTHNKPVDSYGYCYKVDEDKPPERCQTMPESMSTEEWYRHEFIKANGEDQAKLILMMAEDDPMQRMILEMIEESEIDALVNHSHVRSAMLQWGAFLKERVTMKEDV